MPLRLIAVPIAGLALVLPSVTFAASEPPPVRSVSGPASDSGGLVWTKEALSTTPRGYRRIAAAFDEERGEVVLYADVQSVGQTWTWDGTAWHELEIASPNDLFETSMTYDPALGALVLFGGSPGEGTYSDETWVFDDGQWEQRFPRRSPPPRNSAALAYDPILQQVIMFGGYQNGYRRDTWSFDGSTWTRQRGDSTRPPSRSGALMTFDPVRGQVVMVGGLRYGGRRVDGCQPQEVCYPGRTWTWDGARWSALDLRRSPPGRHAQAVASMPDHVVMYGGKQQDIELHDTWLLGRHRWHQSPIPSPGPRWFAAMSYDSGRDEAVLFGGFTRVGDQFAWLTDTWTLSRR